MNNEKIPSNEPISLVLVGIGGYGLAYLSALLDGPSSGEKPVKDCGEVPYRIVGAVDPEPERCERLDDLKKLEIPLFPTLDAFYQSRGADLAVISSPIHLHCEQTCLALTQGSHVLCEKPAAATVQEVDRMTVARNQSDRWVAIGYQWSFSQPIQAMKQDILSGVFGTPLRMKSLCLWPRNHAYYHRNRWAGRKRNDQGRWILDSPMNNAMAHDLHNMLYLLGDRIDRSANAAVLCAELYRANDIKNFDTAALRVMTDQAVEVLFYGSHAIPENMGPIFTFQFSKATIEYPGDESPITARLKDGTIRTYDYPDSDVHTRKLWLCLDAAAKGTDILCGLEAARAQTLCVNGSHESCADAVVFPDSLVHVSGSKENPLNWVEGLDETLHQCFRKDKLPSELGGIGWAREGGPVDLVGYTLFPSMA